MAALKDARALLDKTKALANSPANDALVKKLEELAPAQAPAAGGGGFGGGFGPGAETPAPPATLTSIAGQLVGSVMSLQGAEMAPTAAQLDSIRKQETAFASVMAKWTALKAH